jgi:hypothetical protein
LSSNASSNSGGIDVYEGSDMTPSVHGIRLIQ